MITKIEIDGFKTFRNFEMEFSPLTIIAGANASGKSNLFDAMQLLSRLAEVDIKTAFSEQRGEAIELFTQYGEDEYAKEMRFSVEILANKEIKDNWGGEVDLKYTRLRYELSIKREKNSRGIEDLIVVHEKLVNLKHDEDKWVKGNVPKRNLEYWRPKVSTGKRTKPYIYTDISNGIVTIFLPQDGKRGGRETPANAVSQTVLSGVNSIDFPHVLAAKEEMKSWKFLQLNPDSLRKPSPYLARDEITQSGENLAAALHRIKTNEDFALKDISRRLNNLLPNITDLDVVDDKANKQFVIKIKNRDGREFTSRVLSEGTLRLLALCILQYDYMHIGSTCFEEPENGIHPFRVSAMMGLLKDLSVDFNNEEAPLRQVIINTHSPIVVNEAFRTGLKAEIKVWFSKPITYIENKRKLNITKMIPVEKGNQSRMHFSEEELKINLAELENYLSSIDFEEARRNFL